MEEYRKIPAVQTIQRALPDPLPVAQVWMDDAIRDVVEEIRTGVRRGGIVPPLPVIIHQVQERARAYAVPRLRPVLNATGVMLHTNLGRAPLPEAIMRQVNDVSTQYSTLEYRLDEGKRGSRHEHVETLLARILGAESAMVVNNNAAAVLLALSSLATGREVVVSRGELVEIGGAFRIPDVMALSGARLREVGATNKTHVKDYRDAIGSETALLLKVHQSNFRMMGFVESLSRQDLVDLGRHHQIPVMEDLGSGVMFPLSLDGYDEPSVQETLRAGMDIVTFSGDKLLGGPQAGLVVGRKDLIDAMKHHPLARAVRVDKMTLAALEAVLRWYYEGRGEELPLWQMMRQPSDVIKERAERVVAAVTMRVPAGPALDIVADWSEIGGGSMPGTRVPTYVIRLQHDDPLWVVALERALRHTSRPLIARLSHSALLLDLRTIFPSQESSLIDTIVEACHNISEDWTEEGSP